LVLLPVTRPDAPPMAERANLQTLFAGVRFIRGTPVLLGAITLDLFAVLFGGAVALLPLYAKSILHTGPFGLGVLRSMIAVGALASGAAAALLGATPAVVAGGALTIALALVWPGVFPQLAEVDRLDRLAPAESAP